MSKKNESKGKRRQEERELESEGAPGVSATTGTPNPTYNLISVLYHALQGEETCEKYRNDVEAGDDELEAFLAEVCNQYNEISERAKEILARRIGVSGSMRQFGREEGLEASDTD